MCGTSIWMFLSAVCMMDQCVGKILHLASSCLTFKNALHKTRWKQNIYNCKADVCNMSGTFFGYIFVNWFNIDIHILFE